MTDTPLPPAHRIPATQVQLDDGWHDVRGELITHNHLCDDGLTQVHYMFTDATSQELITGRVTTMRAMRMIEDPQRMAAGAIRASQEVREENPHLPANNPWTVRVIGPAPAGYPPNTALIEIVYNDENDAP